MRNGPRMHICLKNLTLLGWELPFSEFIASGKWDVDDVLRPIYEDAGRALGREFKYPGDE